MFIINLLTNIWLSFIFFHNFGPILLIFNTESSSPAPISPAHLLFPTSTATDSLTVKRILMEKFTNPKRGNTRVGSICMSRHVLPSSSEHILPLLLIILLTFLAGSVKAQYTFSAAGTIGNLASLDAGNRSTPVLIDINADGKWDILTGNQDGTFVYYLNIGTAKYSPATPGTPIWSTTPVSLPGLDVGSFSTPALADIDGDGDIDLFSGDNLGRFHYFENNGGTYTELTGFNNPLGEDEFSAIYDVGSGSTIGFLDTDGDGDLDAVAGNANGEFRHLENEGDENNPYFPRFTDIGTPPAVIVVTATNGEDIPRILTGGELNSTVCVVDMNCDGVFSFVSGTRGGTFQYRQVNQANGNWSHPVANHPLDGEDVSAAVSEYSYPAFGDLDGDGDQDAISGKLDGRFVYFQNTTCNTPPTFTGVTCGSTYTVSLDQNGSTEHTLVVGDIGGAAATPACPDPPSSAGASMVFTPDLLTCANVGVPTTVTLQAVDNFTGVKSSASACQIQIVTTDTSAPVAACKSAYVVEVGQFNVTLGTLPVSAIDSASSDNCTPANLLQKSLEYSYSTTLPFDCDDLGPTIHDITLSVTDASGNISTCISAVVVEDNFAPVASIANLPSLSRELCDYDVVNSVFLAADTIPVPSASDRCSGDTTAYQVSVNGGTPLPVGSPMNWGASPFGVSGTYTLTWYYSDASGNTSTQNQTLVIGQPQLIFSGCPTGQLADLEVTPNNGCFRDDLVSYLPNAATNPPSYDPWATIGSPEICGVPVAATVSTSPSKGASYMVGATTVYFSASDGNGHIANCSFRVVVKPVLASLTVVHPANYVHTTISPTNIAPNVLLNNSQGVAQIPGDGITISALANQCGRVVTWTGVPTVSSPVACANPVSVTAVPASGSFFPIGVTNVKFIATDAKGNTYEVADFDVTVVDLPPTITCPQPSITVDVAQLICGQLVSIPNATATDNCPGVTVVNSITGPGPVNNAFFASIYDIYGNNLPTPVVYTAIDANMNTAQCTVSVFVRDNQKPAWFDCPTNIRVEDSPYDGACGEIVTWYEPFATDNCSLINYGYGTLSVEVYHPTMGYSYIGSDYGNDLGYADGASLSGQENFNFYEGTSTVTYYAEDLAGNQTTCQFQVLVTDSEAPAVYCPLNTIERTTITNCSDVLSNNAYDGEIVIDPLSGCGAPVLTYRLASNPLVDLPSGYLFPRSPNQYNLIAVATDPSGNTSTCPFSIIVSDSTAPVMTNCPANITVNDTDGGCGHVATWTGPNFLDDCDQTNLTITRNHLSGEVFPVGTTLISAVSEDQSGNISAGCSFFVTVLDKTPPVLTTCPTNQTLIVTNADATCTKTFDYSFTVSDDCGPYTVTASTTGTSTSTGSTYSGSILVAPGYPGSVSYTATDGAGNTTTCAFTVTAVDQQGPFFAYCPPSQTISTISCTGTTATWFPPIIYDFCGNGWNLSLPTRAPGSNFAPGGPQLVSYTATDNLGNTSVCSFGITIVVTETTPPVITCPPAITVNSTNCSTATITANSLPVSATATDNCALQTNNPIQILTYLPTDLTIGTGYITWGATDAAGNSAYCSQTIVVRDDTDPVLTCPAPYTAQLQIDQTAFDICANAGLLGVPSVSDCPFDNNPPALAPQQCQFVPGTHPIYWQVTDNAGNSGSCIQTLIVVGPPSCTATTPSFSGGSNCGSPTPFVLPNANCPAIVTVTPAQLGISATDNCGTPLTVANQTINVNATGNQTVTFTATVGANTVSCVRTVSVTCNPVGPCVPSAAPSFAGCGGTQNVNADANCQATVANFGVTASDNCGSVNVNVSNSGPFPLGNTTVIFTATNSAGTSTCSKVVNVIDATAPTFVVCPEDITVEAIEGEEFAYSEDLEIPVATDNCPGVDVALAAGTPEKLFGDGNVVSWIATDASGNETECMQNVTVTLDGGNGGGDACTDQLSMEVANDGSGGDLYGYSVDIDGSYAVVGAPYDDNNKGINSGAAYILQKSGSDWVEVAKLVVPDGDADDLFGESVAISGDRVIVGASKYAGKGAAFVFTGSGSSWSMLAKLLASDGLAGDDFGISVDITATHAIVGAANDDAPKVNQGSVYIFGKDTGGTDTYGQQAKRVAADGDTNDNYGISVSIDGTVAVVGSRYDDDLGTNSGAAYVLGKDLSGANAWGQQQKLTASDGAAGDYFGSSVAIDGTHIIVGSYLDDYSAINNAGSAYVFEDGGISWNEVAKLIPGDAAVSDQFGISVSIESGVALVGSHFDDDMGTNSGSAYVFTEASGWSQTAKLTGSAVTTNDNFGRAVAIGGGDIVVGAYKDDVSGLDQGSAYFYGCDGENRPAAQERIEVTLAGGEVRLFPNPSTDIVNIDITLATEEHVQVIVSDISGKVISTLFDNKMTGENRLQWEGKQFGNGMYFVRIQSASLRETVPVVIVR